MAPLGRLSSSLLVAAALAVAGCGDEDGSGTSPAADGPDPATTEAADVASTEAAEADGAAVVDGEASVAIVDFAFAPAKITVAAGTTVRWTNEDGVPHSIDGGDLGFESAAFEGGETYDVVYEEVGEHPYVCGIHEYMRGTVVVRSS